jgi:putative transposase
MTLENGSKERIDEGTTSYAGAGCSQAAGGRQAVRGGFERPDVLKELEVSEATYHRWRAQYGGMKADDVKRLKELEAENAKLKRIVADQLLDSRGSRSCRRGNF